MNLLLSATRLAIARRISIERRMRLGERFYDGTHGNPLGCTRCGLPFVTGETYDREYCDLCAVESGRIR